MEQDIARLEDKLHQAVKAKTITILTSRLSANADEHFDDADYCLACTASGLTEAETDVMLKLRQHKSNREIADDLNISGKTVETHLKNITKKLKVNGRGKLILEIEKKAQSFRNPS
jgi:DNA-binding CsgD family transcriptional regulator